MKVKSAILRSLAALLLGCLPIQSFAAFTISQAAVVGSTSGTTPTQSFGGAVSVGDLLVVPFSVFSDTETITSVVDSCGNNYSVAANGPAHPSTTMQERPYIAWVVSGFACTPTVTITKSASAGIRIVCVAFQGQSGSPLGSTNGGTGTATTSASINLTSVTSGSLIVAYVVATQTPSAGSGYTLLISPVGSSNWYELGEYNLSSGSGTVAATATLGSSGDYTMAAVEFKVAGGGGSTAVPVFMHHLNQQTLH